MRAEAKEAPALDYLLGEIGHVFDDQAAELQAIEERTAEQRAAFREATETLERIGAEGASIRSELDSLPGLMARADLEANEDEKQRIRSRRKELLAEQLKVEKERQEAREVFGGVDPWQARSVAYQRAWVEAEAVMREAEEQRARLAEAVAGAYRELDEKAEKVRRYGRIHQQTRGA